MFRLPPFGRRAVELAVRVDQPTRGLGLLHLVAAGAVVRLERVEQVAALVALVAAGAEVVAQAALALDEAVGEEGVVGRAVGLGGLALLDEAVLPEAGEDLLHDQRVLRRRRLAEDVEVDPEPLVDVAVDGVVFRAQLLGRHALGECLCLGGRAVLVGAADVEGLQAACPAEAGKYIGRLGRQEVS